MSGRRGNRAPPPATCLPRAFAGVWFPHLAEGAALTGPGPRRASGIVRVGTCVRTRFLNSKVDCTWKSRCCFSANRTFPPQGRKSLSWQQRQRPGEESQLMDQDLHPGSSSCCWKAGRKPLLPTSSLSPYGARSRLPLLPAPWLGVEALVQISAA